MVLRASFFDFKDPVEEEEEKESTFFSKRMKNFLRENTTNITLESQKRKNPFGYKTGSSFFKRKRGFMKRKSGQVSQSDMKMDEMDSLHK